MQQNGKEVSATDAVEDMDTNQEYGTVEGRDITNRVSMVEQDNIKLFKKLDDMTANIDDNATRLCKHGEDILKLFKKLDDLTAAIESITDLKIRS